MNSPARILLIEDDPGIVAALQQVLVEDGFEVVCEQRGDTGLARARRDPFEVVVTDLKLPGLSGLELVRELHAVKPRVPIILMTAHGTTETAIEATKVGAYDYLLKPFEMEGFIDLVSKAAASCRLMMEVVEMGEVVSARSAIIGNSRLMQGIYKEIGRVAAKPVSVLIRGETGTGKELIACALYQHSDRANQAFVAVNCAAIPETLLESELFGHERGAFTGADVRRIGRFEQANHGTLFLDEIGDLSAHTQAKLLRVLQEKCIQRLGGREIIPVDVRVITATHRDLEAMQRDKLFREDLFYRLNVVVISLPPLRQRVEDIPPLVKYFLLRHGSELGFPSPTIQPEAIQILQSQSWPGNVRELENAVKQVLILARGYPISAAHVQEVIRKSNQPALAADASLAATICDLLNAAKRGEVEDVHALVNQQVERELFKQAIELAQGNQAKAARWLGLSRLTLREKLTQFGLHPKQEQPET